MILDDLLEIRKLLSEESRWCKGWYARDKNGKVTGALSLHCHEQ